MSSRPGSNVFGFILLLALLGGFGFLVLQSSQSQGGALTTVQPEGITPPPDGPVSPEEATSAPQQEATPPELIRLRRNGLVSEVVTGSAGQEAVLFTDADEPRPLQAAYGVDEGKIIGSLATPSDPSVSDLVAISTDGMGTVATLRSSVQFSAPPAINRTAHRLAHVSFSNAEQSFGFSLISERLDGSDARTLTASAVGLSLPRWLDDSIAYVIGQPTPDKGQEIAVLEAGKARVVYQARPNEAVTDLVWLDSDELAFVSEPNTEQGAAEAKILSISSKGGDEPILLKDQPGKERALRVDPSHQWLAWITEEQLGQTMGTVSILERSTGTVKDLGTASDLIDWK